MRAKDLAIIGLITVSGVFLFWAYQIDLAYGIWGQYQKSPNEKFTERNYRIFSAIARDWDGKCLLGQDVSTYSDEQKDRREVAEEAAYQIGNVAGLFCRIDYYVRDNWGGNENTAYQMLIMAELIGGKLPLKQQVIKDKLAAIINAKHPEDKEILIWLRSEAKDKHQELQEYGVLDPDNILDWPEPYKALYAYGAEKMQVQDDARLAKHWNGLCPDNPRMAQKSKWRRDHHRDQYFSAEITGNVKAIYCSIDDNLAKNNRNAQYFAIEKLLLVKMLLGALPSERQIMLETLMVKHPEIDMEGARMMADFTYNQLVLYGAIAA